MRARVPHNWVGFSVAIMLVLCSAPHAMASSEKCDGFTNTDIILLHPGTAVCYGILRSDLYMGLSAEDPSQASSAPATANAAVFKLDNYSASLQPGEPTEGGKMKKTVWGYVNVPVKRRIVVHTFGSDFDTELAVYRGTAFDKFVRVTGNDNRAVPGFGNKQSLVQFNAAAGQTYNIQIGSKGAEGDIYAAVFAFPPTGGLSAFLATVGGNAWNGRDYVCNNVACGNPRFILHNSTNKTLTVTGGSNIGPGVTAPAPFTLAPNQIKTAEFTFTASFDRTKTRAVAGNFIFVARDDATVVARAQHRALIVVGSAVLGNVLRAAVTPVIRAGAINETLSFDVTLTNTGSKTAIGCHARHDFSFSSRLKVTWRQVNPQTGAYIAPLDRPANIPAHQSIKFRVFVASQQTQLANPEFPTPVTLDCANTDPAPIDLANVFDITALGLYRPVQVEVKRLAPAGDTLLVPASGVAVVRFSVVNRGDVANLRADPLYIRPIGDWSAANKQFKLTICQTAKATGPCLSSPSANGIQYNAAKNKTTFFRIFVRAPAVDPGFSPGERRVFIKLWQNRPVQIGTFDAPVAAGSVAVRKQ
jgi:hypothetical protein